MYALTHIPNTDYSQLHFNYKKEDLQNEVEKRTSYLGKFRRTEKASHLLDLIAMTKDEEDLFIPLMKSAMADVFDTFRSGVMNLPNISCRFNEDVQITNIIANPPVETGDDFELTYWFEDDTIYIDGNFSSTNLDISTYTVDVVVNIKYKTKFHLLDIENKDIVIPKELSITIPHDSIVRDERDRCYIISRFPIKVYLEQQSGISSAEEIHSIEGMESELHSVNLQNTPLKIGDKVYFEGNYYEVINDTNINTFDASKDFLILNELDVQDGIHYYVNIPNRIDKNLILPLDNAIVESLTNRIILDWIMYAYPTEVETYVSFYSASKEKVYSRCNIFNRVHYKVPRIL